MAMAINVPYFEYMRNEFMESIKTSMINKDINNIQKLYDSFQVTDTDKRTALDQGFRDFLLLPQQGTSQDTLVWETFITLCVEACRREMATVTMPVVLLGDIFDSLTLDKCQQLFTFVENGVAIWKEDLFFTACKNNLLRMCNDLLRRLSRSQKTVFCGRILLFLAKFFPFSERSGLNIVSEFNIENVTEFSSEDAMENKDITEDKKESITEGTIDKIKIDYNLYTKFWALQNFFRNPLLVYNKLHWKLFVSHTENVISAFMSFKVEGVHSVKMSPEQMVTQAVEDNQYFAKFLTNQKLLELQLCDVNFRRYVLVQFVILFQYLNATVKFKSDNQELKVNELDWVKATTEQVYSLLKETPPDGETFAKSILHILKREEFWNNWKNDGCPELRKTPAPTEDIVDDDKRQSLRTPKRAKKRSLGQMTKEAQQQKKFIMGIPELTRMWNYMPHNLDACQTHERNFLLSLEEYFKEAIEQLDPSAMVEDQYKVVNDGNFGWRALRLLALQSSHFFNHSSNNPINKLPEYLEAMIKKIARERPILLASGEEKQEGLEVAETNTVLVNEAEGEAEEEDELLKGDEKRDEIGNSEDRPETPETTQKRPGIASNVLDAVSQIINAQWKELAEKIGLKDTIQYVEESLQTDLERARYVIQLWAEEDPDISTDELAKALEVYGFPKAAAVIKKP